MNREFTTTLVNVKVHGRDGVRMIGRATKYGNPYRLKEHGGDCTRAESVAKFRRLWFSDEYADVREQARSELQGETLGCYCAPELCHGDVIVAFLRGCAEGAES